jgi:hypothetical protein
MHKSTGYPRRALMFCLIATAPRDFCEGWQRVDSDFESPEHTMNDAHMMMFG